VPTPCPKCGAPVTGRFCSDCGSQVGGTRCEACRTELIAEAKFCHRCGLPAGHPAPRSDGRVAGSQTAIPWAVAGIALLALIALVAGQQFRASSPSSQGGPANAQAAEAPSAGARPPDLSTMTLAEQRTRLYDRVMRYAENGLRDSISIFAPMAIAVYEQAPLDLDGRYDLGRIGEVSGDLALAAAQADTILQAEPNHLLGLALAARAARLRNDAAAERRFSQRFLDAEPAERTRRRDEYAAHSNDLARAADDARRSVGR
jgi:hypothetical protein